MSQKEHDEIELLRNEFNANVREDPEKLTVFHEIDESLLYIDSLNTMKENILYPDNLIPEKLPELQISPILEEPDDIQEFTFEGNEVIKCSTSQKQEKSWFNNLFSALRKMKFLGRSHG